MEVVRPVVFKQQVDEWRTAKQLVSKGMYLYYKALVIYA